MLLVTQHINYGKVKTRLCLSSFVVGEEFMQEINTQFRDLQRRVVTRCSSLAIWANIVFDILIEELLPRRDVQRVLNTRRGGGTAPSEGERALTFNLHTCLWQA